MTKKNLSIVDIANQLHISKGTVSFILNGKSKERRISNELTEKVLQFVHEVGYKPNQLARSLRTGKSHTIGLMVEDISNPFFGSLARLIEENAYQNGYKIIYCSHDNQPSKAVELIQMFRERHVDGYILTPTEGMEEDIKRLLSEGAPLILFDRFFAEIATDYVIVDNFSGSYTAVQHLLEQGFKEIGFITIASRQSQMQGRLEGYKKAMEENGLRPHIAEINFHQTQDKIVQDITGFLTDHHRLDAVVFATNYLGTSGLKAIKQLGLKIPEDIGFVSFDDHLIFELHDPSITAIAQPIARMSETLITILLSKLGEKGQQQNVFNPVVLSSKLVIRNSSQNKNSTLLSPFAKT